MLLCRLKADGRKYMINLRTGALRVGDLYQTLIKPPAGLCCVFVCVFRACVYMYMSLCVYLDRVYICMCVFTVCVCVCVCIHSVCVYIYVYS